LLRTGKEHLGADLLQYLLGGIVNLSS
jgi:hypothetical protein